MSILLGADFGIDQFLARDHLTAQTLYPGRMAPVSAVCFVLAGTALILQSMRPESVRLTVVVLLNAIVLTIGVTIIFGYAAHVMAQDPVGSLGRASFHTAAGFVAISVGSMLWLLTERRAGVLSRVRWSPLAVGFAVAVASVLLWQALVARNSNAIQQQTRLAAESIGAQLTSDLKGRVEALYRMAQGWSLRRAQMPRQEWEAEAALYVEHFPDLDAIEWVDSTFKARWVVPAKGRQIAADMDLAAQTRNRAELEAARESTRDHGGRYRGSARQQGVSRACADLQGRALRWVHRRRAACERAFRGEHESATARSGTGSGCSRATVRSIVVRVPIPPMI